MQSEVYVGFGYKEWGMIFRFYAACSLVMLAAATGPVMRLIFGFLTMAFIVESVFMHFLRRNS